MSIYIYMSNEQRDPGCSFRVRFLERAWGHDVLMLYYMCVLNPCNMYVAPFLP